MNILIVEDTDEGRYMLESLLKGSGFEVVSAKNGVEALEKLKKDSFDMIISDILMPKMDGFQLCRECKSEDTLRKIPFVFYTATYTNKKDEEFALSLGAEKFILKPTDPDVFLKILKSVIEEYSKGLLVAPKKPLEDEAVYMEEYNKRLIQKLEKTVLDQAREMRKRKWAEEALKAANQQLDTSNQLLRAAHEELRKLNRDLAKRVKELECLYGLSLLVEQRDITLEEIFQGLAELIPPSWQYPEITGARITFENRRFETGNFRKTAWIQSADIAVHGRKAETIEVCYLKKRPLIDEGPFLREERNLLNVLAERMGKITEHKEAEKTLQRTYENLAIAHHQLEESQAQLIQTEKMSALGTLVAGTAHELNNPMMGIMNFSAHCIKHTSEDDHLYTVLQDIEREAKRCAEIVRNLLTFSHTEKDDDKAYEKGSLAEILSRVLRLLSYRIEKEKIQVTQHITDDTPEIWLEPNSIQQLILNLTTNAFDALEDSEKKEFNVDIRREGEFVRMTIADTGCGIAAGSLRSIFDPFFTTKSVGQGTGLGLSVSQSIIKAHGGQVSCESEPGTGTKFIILLPIERKEQVQCISVS